MQIETYTNMETLLNKIGLMKTDGASNDDIIDEVKKFTKINNYSNTDLDTSSIDSLGETTDEDDMPELVSYTFELTEEPATDQATDPAIEPTEAPATESATEPATEPTEVSATEPVTEPAIEPTEVSATEPAIDLTEDPATEPAIDLTEELTDKSATDKYLEVRYVPSCCELAYDPSKWMGSCSRKESITKPTENHKPFLKNLSEKLQKIIKEHYTYSINGANTLLIESYCLEQTNEISSEEAELLRSYCIHMMENEIIIRDGSKLKLINDPSQDQKLLAINRSRDAIKIIDRNKQTYYEKIMHMYSHH